MWLNKLPLMWRVRGEAPRKDYCFPPILFYLQMGTWTVRILFVCSSRETEGPRRRDSSKDRTSEIGKKEKCPVYVWVMRDQAIWWRKPCWQRWIRHRDPRAAKWPSSEPDKSAWPVPSPSSPRYVVSPRLLIHLTEGLTCRWCPTWEHRIIAFSDGDCPRGRPGRSSRGRNDGSSAWTHLPQVHESPGFHRYSPTLPCWLITSRKLAGP